MAHIEAFDSLDDMLEAENEARQTADSKVQWWQAQIKKGDCFKQWTSYGFCIFGEVLEDYEESHLRNYRLCECFSEGCPYGETGDVHISQISALISREEFEAEKRSLVKNN